MRYAWIAVLIAALALPVPALATDVVRDNGKPWPWVERQIKQWKVPGPEGTITVTRRGSCTGQHSGRTITVGPGNPYGIVGCVTTDRPRLVHWWDTHRETLAHEIGHVWDLTRFEDNPRWHARFRQEFRRVMVMSGWFWWRLPKDPWGSQNFPVSEYMAQVYAGCALHGKTARGHRVAQGIDGAIMRSHYDQACDVIRRPVGSWRR